MPAKSKAADKAATPDLETALAELETIVEKLEQGDLPLEQSLKEFERGIALTRSAQQALSSAEQKVKMLVEANGEQSLQDFAALNADEA